MNDSIINTRISEDLKSELDFISLQEEKSISTIVREALSIYVENYDSEDINNDVCDLDIDIFEIADRDFISPQSFIDLFIWCRSYREYTERVYSDYEVKNYIIKLNYLFRTLKTEGVRKTIFYLI